MGDPAYNPDADFNDDGAVDTGDQVALLAAFGNTCENRQLRYDHRNQLVSFTALDGSPSGMGTKLSESVYVYDAFNRRVLKTVDIDGDGVFNPLAVGDEMTRFVYGCEWDWRLLEEHDELTGSPVLAKTHVYGVYIDEVLTTRDYTVVGSAANRYFYQDDQFSVVAVADELGVVLERYVYSDYGEVLITDAAGSPIPASSIGNMMSIAAPCVGEVDGDFEVTAGDLVALLAAFNCDAPGATPALVGLGMFERGESGGTRSGVGHGP